MSLDNTPKFHTTSSPVVIFWELSTSVALNTLPVCFGSTPIMILKFPGPGVPPAGGWYESITDLNFSSGRSARSAK